MATTPSDPDLNFLIEELRTWLDAQVITSHTIEQIRRLCSLPWESAWNEIVREETAARET